MSRCCMRLMPLWPSSAFKSLERLIVVANGIPNERNIAATQTRCRQRAAELRNNHDATEASTATTAICQQAFNKKVSISWLLIFIDFVLHLFHKFLQPRQFGWS